MGLDRRVRLRFLVVGWALPTIVSAKPSALFKYGDVGKNGGRCLGQCPRRCPPYKIPFSWNCWKALTCLYL